MLQLPSLPSWDAMHPIIVHFPIVLLLLAPAFVLFGIARSPGKGSPYFGAGVVLLLSGTLSLFAAIESGEATAELADLNQWAQAVLKSHQELASETRNIFVALSAISLIVFVLPHFIRQSATRLFSTILPLAFLAFYAVGIIFLVNTGHAGGRLVHQYGVHALVSPASAEQADNGGGPREAE